MLLINSLPATPICRGGHDGTLAPVILRALVVFVILLAYLAAELAAILRKFPR